MNLNTAYEILGMTRSSSSEEEIKKAYKELALKTHPGIYFLPYLYWLYMYILIVISHLIACLYSDKNRDDPEAAEKFARISNAYEK